MQTVTWKHLIDLFAAQTPVTLTSGALNTEDRAAFDRFANRVLRRGWEWLFWPDLMAYQERHYRDAYAVGTAYAAPSATAAVEVWYSPAGRYFQALQTTTGNAPATVVNGAYVAQGPYWADVGAPAGADWAASTAYTAATASVAGTIVRNPGDGRYYMCITSHTSSSSFDATKFGILTGFNAYVPYEQSGLTYFSHVLEVWSADYRTVRSARRLRFEYDELGVRLTNFNVYPSVWLKFRRRPSLWRAANYDAALTYAVGEQIYFASGTGAYEGDFWQCATATSAGQSPSTHASKWTQLTVPAFLADFAAEAASLGFREGQTKLDAALMAQAGELWTYLYDEKAKLSSGRLVTASVANLT